MKKIKFLVVSGLVALTTNCFAVQNNPIVVVGTDGTLLSSNDGVRWTQQVSSTGFPINTIAHGKNGYVALDDYQGGDAIISSDGITWTTNKITNPRPDHNILWTHNRFIATNGDSGTIATSPDGINWTSQYSDGNVAYYQFAATDESSKEMYVALSSKNSEHNCSGIGLYSSDSSHWNKISQDLPCVWNPIWVNNQFIAPAQKSGYLDAPQPGFMTSPDGQTWTWQAVPNINGTIGSLAWGDNKYVALEEDDQAHGYQESVLTSTDGKTWTQKPLNLSGTSAQINKIKWVANQFIAVGFPGLILTSPDGINWTRQNSGTDKFLFDVA